MSKLQTLKSTLPVFDNLNSPGGDIFEGMAIYTCCASTRQR